MGGVKESGIGVRHGAEGIRKYCRTQTILISPRADAARASRSSTPTRRRSARLVRALLRAALPPLSAATLGRRGVEPGGEALGDQLEVLGRRRQRRRDGDARAELAHAARRRRRAPIVRRPSAAGSRSSSSGSRSIAASVPMPPRTSPAAGWPASASSASWSGPSISRPRVIRPSRSRISRLASAGGGAGRVAGVGRALAEDRAARLLPERLGDAVGDDHAAERQVAAGDALGEGDHVRHDVPALDPEPGAQAPEARRSPSRRRAGCRCARRSPRRPRCSGARAGSTPPAPITGSTKKAAMRSAPIRVDRLLERLDRVVGDLLGLDLRPEAGAVGGDPADRGAVAVGSVVALRAADQQRPLGLAELEPVAARELGRRRRSSRRRRRSGRPATASARASARISRSSSVGAQAKSPNAE